jgi:hypothetical protein
MLISEMPLPPGLNLQGPPVVLPIRAVGAVVLDARSQVIANCPNAPLADVIAYTINTRHGVHP